MSRTLADLLHEADEAAPPPPTPVRLAEAVRARSRTVAFRRRVVAVAALPLVAIAPAAWLIRGAPPAPGDHAASRASLPTTIPAPPANGFPLPAEAAALKAEASLRLAVADALRLRDERRRRPARSFDARPPMNLVDSIESEREKAALTLLDHADRLRRDLKQADAALAAYRRTIELFPETRWAAVAKQRIEDLKPDARDNAVEHPFT